MHDPRRQQVEAQTIDRPTWTEWPALCPP
jgi:hypothetical protein